MPGPALPAGGGSVQVEAQIVERLGSIKSETGDQHELQPAIHDSPSFGVSVPYEDVRPRRRTPRLIGDRLDAARKALGHEAVDHALAEGREMDFDAAIAYAHDDT